ncbi:hypothetical protein GGF50DRAFT_121796 [Schizophyllum commune]
MSSDANAANSSATLLATIDVQSAAIGRLSDTILGHAHDIRTLKENIDEQAGNVMQQDERVAERLGQVEKIFRGHAPMIQDLEERLEYLESIVRDGDSSDVDSDRVSIRSIIDAHAPADPAVEGVAEPPDHPLPTASVEAAPDGVVIEAAPVPAATLAGAAAEVPATAPAVTELAALGIVPKKRYRDEDAGDVEALEPPETKRHQPVKRGLIFSSRFKFSALWS